MRWFNFGILVFITLVVQSTLGGISISDYQKVMPDLFLGLAVVLAFNIPAKQAPIACWILGLAKDIGSQMPLGCYAFSFGLLGWAIVWLREIFYGDNPIVLIVLTFLCSVFSEQFALIVSLLKHSIAGAEYAQMSCATFYTAITTALLTPLLQILILRLHKLLGISLHKRHKY